MGLPQESPGIQKKDSAFYTWSFPGAPVRIHLYLNVVRELQKELALAASATPPNRVEIAGVLLGKGDLRTSQIVEVRDFVPVISGTLPNSPQTLSEADQRKFAKSLAAHESSAGPRLAVVGYYHARGSEHLSLNDDDLALIHAQFRDPTNVFLMIRPGADGPANAGFFFWDGDQINADFTFLEFPLDAKFLETASTKPSPRPKLVEPAPKLEAPVSEPAHVSEPAPVPPSAAPRAKASRSGWLWLSGAAIVVALLTGVSYWAWQQQPTAPSPAAASTTPSLSLQVERQSGDLKVTWDRNSSFIATAKAGLLQVRDGEHQQQDLYLDPGQLRTGSVVYTPVSATVQFRLEVFAAGDKSLSETVLALTAPRAEPPKPKQ